MKILRMVVVLGAVLFSSSNLRAESHQAVALPIQMMGFFAERQALSDALNSQISSTLIGAGYDVLGAKANAKANCHETDCLESIRRNHRVDLVLTSQVSSESMDTPAYVIRVWAFEPKKSAQVMASEATCSGCSEKAIVEKLRELCTQLLGGDVNSPELSLASAAPSSGYSAGRRAGYIALGTIGAIGTVGSFIALGLVLNAHHQLQCDASFPVNRTCPFENDATVPAVIAGVSAAASIVIMGVGFGLAAKEGKKRKLAVTSPFFPIGTMAQLKGSF